MNYRRANIAAALCAACLILAAILAGSLASRAVASPLPPACAEDDPCWNWATMGNHRRGVVLLDGTPRVVGVCGFNRLWAHGAIRYRIGKYDGLLTRLRGDYAARTMTDCPWRIRENRPYPWHQSPGVWATLRGY